LDQAQHAPDLALTEHNITHGVDLNSPLSQLNTASAASCAANPGMRFEWRQYSASDRAAFIAGIKCLMSRPPSGRFPPAQNRYEDFVRLHQLYMPNIHNNPKFLVWHRYYLWTFEQVMRAECGFNRAWPWWDERLDAGHFPTNDMFSNAYFGALPNTVNGNPVCVNNGAFAGITLHIGPGNSNVNHCLSRGNNNALTAQCNDNFVNACNSRTDYADMEGCSEGGPHAYGHNGIGGAMSDVSASPSDPLFWMHHSFIDRNFRVWQNLDVNRRTTSISGRDHFNNPLTMNTIVSMGGIRPDVRIGDIMNTLGGVVIGGVPFCYRYTY
jgi:tyrosinase